LKVDHLLFIESMAKKNNACQDSVLMMSGGEGPAAIPLLWAT
jgi:hypothetical protein